MNRKTIRKLIRAWNEIPHDYRYQIYGIVTPRKNGEFTLNCYAVKETKRFGLQLTEVNRAWSDRPYYQCKNIWKNVWGQTMVEFDERRNRPQESYGWYDGKWGEKMEWNKDNGWFMGYIKYLNLDALAETKYKYCAFEQYRGELSLVPYCKLFAKHKQVEILAKNDMSHLISKRVLERMENDRAFCNFVRNHANEIAKQYAYSWRHIYSPSDIVSAYLHGWTLDYAREVALTNAEYAQAPKGVNRMALKKYLEKNDIDKHDYYHYAKNVAYVDENILEHGKTFPRDFHAEERRVLSRVAVIQAEREAVHRERVRQERLEMARRMREREKELRKVSERIGELLTKMKNRLAWRVGDWTVVLPTTKQEFIDEGNAMNNCIGGYYESCANGETMCFFVRRNGKRVADVEASPSTGKILQCRAHSNRITSDETRTFAETMAKKLAKEMTKLRKVA